MDQQKSIKFTFKIMTATQKCQIQFMKIEADSHKFTIKALDRLILAFSHKIHSKIIKIKQFSHTKLKFILNHNSKESLNQFWSLQQHRANKANTSSKHSNWAANTKDISWTACATDRVSFTTKMEENTTEIGTATKCKDTGSFTINLIRLHMRANGLMINFQGEGYSIINCLTHSNSHSITEILTIFRNFGQNTKVFIILGRLIRRRYETWAWNFIFIKWRIFWRTIR